MGTGARLLGGLLALALAFGPLPGPRAGRAEMVRWTDEKGEVHIGELDDVPDRYKKFVKPLSAPDAPTAPACQAAKDAPKGGAKIRFKPNRDNRIFAFGCINGKGPVAFLVDTGASITGVSEAVLTGFGVDFTNAIPIAIRGWSATSASKVVRVESLQIEGARVAPFAVATIDGTLFGMHVGPYPVDGLLGQDFMREFYVDFDLQRGIVVFTPKSRPGATPKTPPPAPPADK